MNSSARDTAPKDLDGSPPLLRLIFASLFDMVLLFFVHYGIYTLILLTPISSNLNGYRKDLIRIQDTYKLETGYGEKVLTEPGKEDGYLLYYEEDGKTSYTVHVKDFSADENGYKTSYLQYLDKISTDAIYQEKQTYYHIHNYLITAVLCGGIVEAIFLLLIPMTNKKRATLGMRIFHLSLVSAKSEQPATIKNLLLRFLFIYLFESLLPYFFLAQWTLIAVPLVLGVIALLNDRRRTLHDFLSGVRTKDSNDCSDLDDDEKQNDKKEVHTS